MITLPYSTDTSCLWRSRPWYLLLSYAHGASQHHAQQRGRCCIDGFTIPPSKTWKQTCERFETWNALIPWSFKISVAWMVDAGILQNDSWFAKGNRGHMCGKSGRAALCFLFDVLTVLTTLQLQASGLPDKCLQLEGELETSRQWAASSCFNCWLWTACHLFDCALALSHPCLERKDLGEMKVSVEDYGSCCLLLGHVPKSMLPWPANWCCLCQDTHWQKWSASKCWRQPRWRTITAAARGRRKLEHCKVTTASCLYISYLNIIHDEDQRHVLGTLM